ncbi:hypothetical protein BGW80DRAFT_1320197 [Lactifluus volemus]|nr:hypothetical protein BGW80DRAFT_1320197 [Lactifluus volemus]
MTDGQGSIGRPASSNSTQVAICRPNSAGSGPSRGKMRTRKSHRDASSFTERHGRLRVVQREQRNVVAGYLG